MKRIFVILMLIMPMMASAQTTKTTTAKETVKTVCPLEGNWSGWLGGGWGDTALFLVPEAKKGVNPSSPNLLSNGNLYTADEEYVKERTYNLVYLRKASDNSYEFTVQLMVGKQLKTGKMLIRKVGDKIVMSGVDAWAKQQPFHNKSLELSKF